MENSIFIARLLAFMYLAMGFGVMANAKWYMEMFKEMKKSLHFTFLAGMLALIAGFSIITFHNTWTGDWTVIITLIGWISFLKGIFLLMFPKSGMKIAEKAVRIKNIAHIEGSFAILFGLALGYLGFFI